MSPESARIVREDCMRVWQESGMDLEPLAGSCLLVTGGSGFMGSWIAEMVCMLNEKRGLNAKVYIFARDKERFERNIGHLSGGPGVEFIRCDVRNIVDIPKNVHYVIHAAGTPDSRTHTTNPIETMVTIAEGTSAVLRAADRVSDLRMLVNVSSSSIYGAQPATMPKIPESYCGPVACWQTGSAYAEAKRYGEALVTAARSEARMPVVTVRPFTFIGAYQPLDAPWAANNFINDAMSKRPIRILGDGQTVRGTMYGADMALWILTVAVRAGTGEVYNIGSDDGITLEKMAGKVASKFQPAPEVVLNASLTGNVPNSVLVPDTSAARSTLGLRVVTDIDLALQRTIMWYRNRG